MTTAPCPICRRPAIEDYRPFCSRRCADQDLTKWLTGAYAVPVSDDDDPDSAFADDRDE